MLHLKNTIIINKPLKEVFDFVSDQRNNPKWNYYVLKVEKINEPEEAGAAYMQTRKSDRQKFRVEKHIRNELLVVQTLPGERPAAIRKLVFSGNEYHTIIKDHMTLKVPIPSFLSHLFGRVPRKAIKQNLEKLKELMEVGHVRLQDGRQMFY